MARHHDHKKWNKRVANKRRLPAGQRARHTAAHARAWGRRVAPWATIALVAVLLPYGVFQAYLYATTSPTFGVASVEIKGAQIAGRDAIMEASGVVLGQNIFSVDEESMRARVTAHPWVEHAEVTISLPGTVSIELEERHPVALVIDGANYVAVDHEARPIKVLDERDPIDALCGDQMPMISGPTADDLMGSSEATQREAIEQVQEAMATVDEYERLGLLELAPISEVHVDRVMGTSLVLGEQGTEVRLGRGRLTQRLERFAVVYDSLAQRGVPIEYVLVDQQESLDRVAVGPAKVQVSH